MNNIESTNTMDKFTLSCSKCGKTFDIMHFEIIATSKVGLSKVASKEFYNMLESHIKERCIK